MEQNIKQEEVKNNFGRVLVPSGDAGTESPKIREGAIKRFWTQKDRNIKGGGHVSTYTYGKFRVTETIRKSVQGKNWKEKRIP